MTFNDDAASNNPMPGSPPDLTGSKSSKSSSFHSSYQSDDNSIHTDSGHFEEIGLDDEARAEAEIGVFESKTSSNPYDATYASDLRATAKQRNRVPMAAAHGNRIQRELTAKGRPQYPTLRGQIMSATAVDGLGLKPLHNGASTSRRGFTSPSTHSLPQMKRNRSSSPSISVSQSHNLSAASMRARRGSWQSNREKKSAKELEKECDEDDGDVPDECFLENIPMSPRPPQERTPSVPPSTSTSPERPPKEKIKPVGNGTSPRPAEQGELRSPKPGLSREMSMGQFPINYDSFPKARAKSWTAALSELSEEAKALTEALEAHAEEEEKKEDPRQRRSFGSGRIPEKPRIRSAIAELPPLRRTNIMIDPLPISKEKEAVLSRTRPSWLPPKDPVEEKRHLKEYQRMMALSLEAERKREREKRAKSSSRDDTAGTLSRIWEEHVLPNWDTVTSQKRTRELWWRGIAPRSRAAVWTKAIGNELGLSDSSYTAALRRAKALETTIARGSQLSADEERKKGWLEVIESDVKSTYPDLKIFQPEGPLHQSLLDVLRAYAMYRSDVGYVHGTSTIAAMLLLNLPSPSASFQALSNILNRPIALSFHTGDSGATSRAYSLLLSMLEHKSPRLHTTLANSHLAPQPDAYLRDIFSSLFTGYLNLDNASRLWDIMVFEGDAVLVRAGVAYLTAMEGRLFGATSPKDICDIVKAGLDTMSEEDWVQALRSAGKQ
ncbi:TBC domain-containing [Hyphodiscus hymeniophilus]|uniref:TBC domain-containing n=1 Tax=Hyphodiscus hymeniophilus TaxID=353542 RepID=A0A9P6VMI0_9HELO|nr:TBC domain-containing [Hyphodiscus hymeniophilus]